ncbi:MAG: PSD1 and planctomycete cytochrome C domain-containing protein, partial [Acidobacteriota bacterium]
MRAGRSLASLLCCAVLATAAVDYESEVRPLLAKRCVGCHGPALQMSHLRLDQKASLLKGGESGIPAIEPGSAAKSLLIRYVSGTDPKLVMPPKGTRLTPEQVALLSKWIDEGVVWPSAEAAVEKKEDPRLQHWAWQPLRKPEVPAVQDAAWVRNPIDAFVLAKLEARGWKPNPVAKQRDLLRRVYLNVIGLPPTIAEQDAFKGDVDAEVKKLLARPEYGERWARHWLDVVRYGDTNGYERDATKPLVWQYRDYVIRAFNNDVPYDRFVIEQLAGDELPDSNANTMIATGYNRLGPWDDEPADPAEDHFDQLDDLVSTTSQAFLGLTLGCARCHNHKFEPLTTRDYYSMVAVFHGLTRPRKGRTELDRPVGEWPEVQHNDAYGEPELPRGYFMEERSPKAPPTFILIRGKASSPGPEVEPVPPALIAAGFEAMPAGPRTSQRRLAFARWLTSKQNLLAARVMVNRVWQWNFGEGLVRTPNDFGVMGAKPTHRELLDWLAVWFMENGWSVKKLNALIAGSNTYRMSKAVDAQADGAKYAAEDPEDMLLWRVPYKRLEAEAILDSMAAVSGRLNTTMYGPPVYPE